MVVSYIVEYDSMTDDYMIFMLNDDGSYSDEYVYVDEDVFNNIEELFIAGEDNR